jgi:hypothetical protein
MKGYLSLTKEAQRCDPVYAHMWFNIAASLGNAEARDYRNNIAEKMTAADISKAQKLARECVRKEYKGC